MSAGMPPPPPAPDSQDQRLARLVHELRAPLTAILGYADQLIGDLPDRIDALQRLHVLRDNGEHLLELVNGITQRARGDDVDPVRVPWASDELDPIETISTVTQLLRPCAEIKQLSLVARADPPLPARIEADGLRVRQILFNLVGNAIKFTAEGGVLVTVEARAEELHFRVIDTGSGIPPERQAGLFHPFETGDGGGGDGLGLYISHRLAQALGGRLQLESSSEHGCTFLLALPRGEVAGVGTVEPGDPRITLLDRAQRRQVDEGPLAGLRVLVVEHGPDHQLLLSAVLKRAGCAVTIAGTGLKAIQAWQQAERAGTAFELVVISERPARRTGAEVLADLRERGYTAPAIGTITGSLRQAEGGDFDRACDQLLAKPIDPAVLRATAANVLGRNDPTDRFESGPRS